MEVKNVVFDFGGVLVDWNPRYVYETIFDNKDDMEYFLRNITTEEWNLQQDAGRSLMEATKILQLNFPEYESLIRYYYGQWEDMLKDAIHENVALLEPLSKNYRLFGLTNWSAETWPVAWNRFPFFRIFEGIVVSGQEGMRKPHPEIYHLLLQRYDLKAEACLFIDDNASNIEAAKALGFHTIHCKDINLREVLKDFSIVI